MGDIVPFPPRGLPPGAENWGRTVEERIIAVERLAEVALGEMRANQALSDGIIQAIGDQVEAIGSLNNRHVSTAYQLTKTSGGLDSDASWNKPLPSVGDVSAPTGFIRIDLSVLMGPCTAARFHPYVRTMDNQVQYHEPGNVLSIHGTGGFSSKSWFIPVPKDKNVKVSWFSRATDQGQDGSGPRVRARIDSIEMSVTPVGGLTTS